MRTTWHRLLRLALVGLALSAAGIEAHARNEFEVGTARAWRGYAIPNGLWLSGDYTGDGRSDLLHLVNGADYAHPWVATGNGRFDVRTFRPWRGYAMPNGRWLNADLNGDDRMDVVHVVNNTDYVHPWLSRGDGTFNVRTFRPWRGYAMPNGPWLVADLNGDDRDDLVHVVRNTDYVHTWISNGDGTFRVGTFRPWNGYAMPNGVWRVGDFDGDGRQDLVHAVQGRDVVHTWTSNGNGTFRVGTFRPWRGYSIPNGQWQVGDFNGDDRDDILHVVNRTDYVHTWLSRGNGTFDVGTFRPWRGYAMPNGIWRVTDLDEDGKDDVVHAVARTDYAHVWRSTTPHRFQVTTFSPWRGYAIPNGLWFAGDYDGDDKGDILHVVNGRNYVHPWLSRMPGPNEMAVGGLEVTQSVQDMDHSVPMIAAKATVARAYPDLNAAGSRAVRGRLFVRNGSTTQTLNSLNTVTVNPAQNGNLRLKRETTDLGLNFRIPANLLGQGWLFVRLAGLTDASTGAAVACSNCGSSGRWVRLQDGPPLRVRVFGMRYTQDQTTHQPRAQDFALIRSWLGRVYPVDAVNMTQLTVNANASPPFSCNAINAQLAATRAVEVGNNSVDARTHYYGLVDDGGFFMRGCAAGIPGSPQPQTVSSGPAGAGTFGWDNDGSYADWYTGHELGHTFGRSHIGSGCGDSDSDPNYPYPNGQIADADGAFVGFDVGDAGNGIAMAALPGTQWTDVMSYCQNQWMSDYTYRAIFERLNDENALPGGPTPAVAGIEPAAGGTTVEPAAAGPAPIIDGERSAAAFGGPHGDAAFIAPASVPPNDVAPAMAPPDLDVAPAYETAPEVFVAGEDPLGASASGEPAGPVPPELRTADDMAGDQPPTRPDLPAPAGFEPVREARLSVVGTVNLTAGDGDIAFVNPVQQGIGRTGAADDTAVIRVLGDDDDELARHRVFVLLDSELHPGDDVTGVIDALIPVADGARALALVLEGEEVDRFTFPQLDVQGFADARQVSIETDLDEAAGTVAVSVPQAQRRPDESSYGVEVSDDGGATWQVVALGQATPDTVIDVQAFDAGQELGVRVTLNTGLRSEVIAETTVELP